MELEFFGGAGEVGRNCFMVSEGRDDLMLDCGVKLGEVEEHPLLSPEDIHRVRRIAISHTHLDHIGFLPYMLKKGCKAPIYCTKPTRDMTQLLLSDYQRIGRGRKITTKDVERVMSACNIVEYGEKVCDGMTFSFHNAGHILGSAMVLVEGERKKLLYSADVNMRGTKLLDAARTGLEAEVLILECTYGGKEDKLPAVKTASNELAEAINQTIIEGGSVLIPTFAVGRGQEILLTLDAYMRSGLLEKVPIFIDGMIVRANRIYRHNILSARDEIQKSILVSEYDPFKSPFFHQSERKDRSDVLEQQCIIVSTSGMLTGGPVLGYLKALADNKRNKLLLVGYQAEGTLGRKLLSGEKKIIIDKEEVDVEMSVGQVPFSAHSDHQSLLQLANSTKELKKVFLVHGDPHKIEDMRADLEKKYEVIVPKNGEVHAL
ncbi:MBL fold metallo-hydrolase [Candidatus Micrarchaeota archaeon]|nr:MBL fold metallo-hydrolase [Candidatus Micrarchaeota archaeon]